MKLNIKSYHYGVLATIGMGMCLLATPVSAKVTGQCAICHTMHNSQGGAAMALDAAVTDPNDVLLLRGCVACHTGTNIGTNVIPYVTDINPPNYLATGTGTGTNTLAGGSFYWVANNDAGNAETSDSTGHNVATGTMAGLDSPLGLMPPGGTTALTAQLRCAGTNGCHGDTNASSDFAAIKGTHHADDSVINGDTVATSFRFLDGIVGIEDSDWEYQADFQNHNQYKGFDRENDTINQTDTISSLCARCHNDFHNGSGNVGGDNGSTTTTFASPWVRHPTDFDMGNTAAGSEYRDYGGAGLNAYVPSAPVASAAADAVLQTIDFINDQAIVTCISCHRAHGSPNADLLRWDYSTVEAGVSGSGACFECHTTK